MTLRDASGTVNDYSQVFNVENELASVTNNGSSTSFAYDAAGIRVMTTAPNGTVTDYPFPGYEVEALAGAGVTAVPLSFLSEYANRENGRPLHSPQSEICDGERPCPVVC